MVMEQLYGRNVFMGNQVSAKYHLTEEDMYRHNAFIEALPPVLMPEEVANRIRRKPAYVEAGRYWNAQRRLQSVQTIANYIEPLPIHLDLEQRFSRMIRNGYMTRNPISTEWIKQMRAGFRDLDWGTGEDGYVPVIRSSAAGFSIIGTSGVGKTTAVDSVLSLYPQVILHTEYNGHSFDRAQLVWLKLDCPFDGSLKGLCLNFFQAIDMILGTRYYQKFGNSRRTVDELLPNMAHLAAALGLGVLVIDEIQRLNEAKSGGAAKMLNFFVQLMNTISVPVVLVGTFKALHFMTREFAQARRSAGQGDLIWANLARDDVWDFFIDGLWEYQWTSVSSPLTPALSQVLYEESQGIVDIAVKLYMLAQWHVIGQEDERIYPGLIRDVARESLKLAKPVLDALKTRDIQKLSQISDVYPPIRNLDEYFHRAADRITIEGTLNTLRNQQKAQKNIMDDDMESPIIRVARWLVEAGIEPTTARKCAVKALNRHGSEIDLNLVMQEAFALAVKLAANHGVESSEKEESTQEPNRRKRKEKVVSLSGDLREIVGKSKKKGISAYQALKDAGVIKPAGEFLAM